MDLRPKGEPGPIFGNALAFHFVQFNRSETADAARPGRATLWRQLADAVREGHIEASAAAMEFIKHRRLVDDAARTSRDGRAVKPSPSTLQTSRTSRRWSDPFFGRRVVNAYHVSTVMPRPGIGVFFYRCRASSNIVVSWIEGAVGEVDEAWIIETVRGQIEGVNLASVLHAAAARSGSAVTDARSDAP